MQEGDPKITNYSNDTGQVGNIEQGRNPEEGVWGSLTSQGLHRNQIHLPQNLTCGASPKTHGTHRTGRHKRSIAEKRGFGNKDEAGHRKARAGDLQADPCNPQDLHRQRDNFPQHNNERGRDGSASDGVTRPASGGVARFASCEAADLRQPAAKRGSTTTRIAKKEKARTVEPLCGDRSMRRRRAEDLKHRQK